MGGPVPPHGRRIIPARAGFTAFNPRRSLSHPDHPRSRGVYDLSGRPDLVEQGSSPLARGLPLNRKVLPLGGRIIPARAGFTQDWRRRARRRRDHPRSRGVYQPEETEAAYASGSSPLARGLPDGEGYVPFGGRIIPARAGFTRSTFSSKFATSGSSPLARGLPAPLFDL